MNNETSNAAFRGEGHSAFVLFPLGSKRFALPAAQVSELARPDELHPFPHTTPLLSGVLVRRGKIVPVCDVAQVLIGPGAPARRYYLIASRAFQGTNEWTAIPVSGECMLTHGTAMQPEADMPPYVSGLLSEGSELVRIVDLEKLAYGEVAA
jgi:chemotaxis signal transduction protein